MTCLSSSSHHSLMRKDADYHSLTLRRRIDYVSCRSSNFKSLEGMPARVKFIDIQNGAQLACLDRPNHCKELMSIEIQNALLISEIIDSHTQLNVCLTWILATREG